jgi:hypothetical protein
MTSDVRDFVLLERANLSRPGAEISIPRKDAVMIPSSRDFHVPLQRSTLFFSFPSS